ncbi:MAG: FGGY-family carbohydrate kinase [bacterium]
MAEFLLGIDIGTTSCKVGLYGLKGNMVAQASKSYPTYQPAPHEIEQNPEDWWKAVEIAIGQIGRRPKVKMSSIVGIGLSGQTPTQVFVDRKGKILRRAIIWRDTRSEDEARWIRRVIGKRRMEKFLGMDLPIQPNWPPARLLWLKKHEPQILNRTFKILQAKDFIGYKLTGCFFSDRWCSKGMVNLKTGRVSSEFFGVLGISEEIVPEIYKPYEVVGRVRKEIGNRIGIPKGIPVVAGWSDALCGMLATGSLSVSGRAFNITGTSEIVGLTTLSIPKLTYGLMSIPSAITNTISVLYGPTQSGGDSLKWAGETLLDLDEKTGTQGLSLTGLDSLLSQAESIVPGSKGMIFLPYLEGERAPIWDANAKGLLIGITRTHRRSHLIRSILEGVAYSVRHLLEIAEKSVGRKVEKIRIAGGGAKIDLWNQIRADVTGRCIEKLQVLETGTLGAAMLASSGIGVYKSLNEVSKQMVHVASLVEPVREHRKQYDKLFGIYKRLYPLLKPVFHEL